MARRYRDQGRAHTVRDLPGGLHAEAGGSFVGTGDRSIRGLARELRVPLVEAVWSGERTCAVTD